MARSGLDGMLLADGHLTAEALGALVAGAAARAVGGAVPKSILLILEDDAFEDPWPSTKAHSEAHLCAAGSTAARILDVPFGRASLAANDLWSADFGGLPAPVHCRTYAEAFEQARFLAGPGSVVVLTATGYLDDVETGTGGLPFAGCVQILLPDWACPKLSGAEILNPHPAGLSAQEILDLRLSLDDFRGRTPSRTHP